MKSNLNLMTLEWQRRHLLKRHLIRWGRAAALIAVLTGVTWWRVSGDLGEIQTELTSLEERASLYRNQLAENTKLEQGIVLAERRKKLFNSLSLPQQPLQLVGIISASARRQDGQIRIASFELAPAESVVARVDSNRQRNARPAVDQAEEKQPVVRTSLNLSGIAENDIALTRFVASLREAGVFVEVELKSSRKVQRDDRLACEYDLSCIY